MIFLASRSKGCCWIENVVLMISKEHWKKEEKLPLTSFPPMDSNIFSSCTRNCWMLFIKIQGYKEKKKKDNIWEIGMLYSGSCAFRGWSVFLDMCSFLFLLYFTLAQLVHPLWQGLPIMPLRKCCPTGDWVPSPKELGSFQIPVFHQLHSIKYN